MEKQNQLLKDRVDLIERINHCRVMIGVIIVIGVIIFSSIGLSALKHPDEGLFHAFSALLMCWLVPDCIYSMVRQIGLLKEIVKNLNSEIRQAAQPGAL